MKEDVGKSKVQLLLKNVTSFRFSLTLGIFLSVILINNPQANESVSHRNCSFSKISNDCGYLLDFILDRES